MPESKANRNRPARENTLDDSIDTAEEQIEYMIGLCSYGSILVAATNKGICAVFLDNHPDKLYKELRQQFPDAELVHGDERFEKMLVKVIAFIENPNDCFELPLDIRGTTFQQKVWAALVDIPYGETRSYSEVAMQIGTPSAVRAVAQACAANKLAVIIPCHRVISVDGDLSGYRWGIQRKKRLLEREQD